jgi:hypothetical protein
MAYVDYTDKDVSMQKWLEEIAPKYFDFDASELYATSQFGYMNEVMSTVENDTHHSVSIARREFYPTTAHYLRSFYKMAALQQIGYPLANPATATAILILRESDILTYGVYDEQTRIRTFVLDNSAVFYAGSIPFMLDYPIKITVRDYNINSSLVSLKHAYTARYTSDTNNSLSHSNQKYIKSRVYVHGPEILLLLKVTLRQCTITRYTQSINSSPLISNISMDFNVGKYMCNFEAFYNEAYSDSPTQLIKLPVNSNPSKKPYCEWQMIDDENLRISFPNNPYFNPKYNSDLSLEVYTTLGEYGNFERYDGPLSCQLHSDKYPYNNSIRMTGKITGSSLGGYSMPTLDDFKNDVIAAYATNKTYTTDSDLQVMFDKTARTTRNRIIFSKRRDDCFERMYGAYMLLKDASGYVIPTNSLTATFFNTDVSVTDDDGNTISKMGYRNGDDVIIKAGTVWRYNDESPEKVVEVIKCTLDEYGNYKLTHESAGNIYAYTSEEEAYFKEVEYLRDEQNHYVPRTNPDGEYITTTNLYSWFNRDTGEYETTNEEQIYITELNEYTMTIDNIPALDDEGNPIIDEETGLALYYIPDYGIIERSIYSDGRSGIITDERKYLIYPDTNTSLVSVDNATYEEIYEATYESFMKFLEVAENLDGSYTEEEVYEAKLVLEQRGFYDEASAAEAAKNIANTVYESYAYTNPFLIRYNKPTGVSAYYRNTFNNTYPLDLIHVEDASILQFNSSGISVYRNSLFGENFYKITINLQPSISDADLQRLIFTAYTEEATDENSHIIRAFSDGIVERFVYIHNNNVPGGQAYAGSVYMIIRYYPGGNEDDINSTNFPIYVVDANVNKYIEENFPNAANNGSVIRAIRVGGSPYYTLSSTGEYDYKLQDMWNTELIAGTKFKKGNIIATHRDIDRMQVRIVGMFKQNDKVYREYYIPFTYESYTQATDSYSFSAYISTDDIISSNDLLEFTDGIFRSASSNVDDGVAMDPEKIFFSIGIFVKYEDENLPMVSDESGNYASRYARMPYIEGYTLSNVYENPNSDPIKFLELFRFIRSTTKVKRADYVDIDPNTYQVISDESTYTEIREIPLVRAEWAKNPGNIYDLFRLLKTNHDWVAEAYDLLDNNFTINLKLYNTYGRSRYLMMGNSQDISSDKSTLTPLNSVTLKFNFGAKLRPLIDVSDFTSRFITYIRTYIENFNTVEDYGISIYMSDLFTKLNQKFKDEVVYLEFYGINNNDAHNSQIIQSWKWEDINALGYNKYIPEFINLYTTKTNGMFVPTVDLTIIE